MDNLKQVVDETLILKYNYINNVIPLIKDLAEEFYQNKDSEIWGKLGDLFEGIQWIIQTLSQIDSIKELNTIINDYESWNEYVQIANKLNDIVPELEDGVINKDNILIGDILLYEIAPTFEELLAKLELLKPEGIDLHVN